MRKSIALLLTLAGAPLAAQNVDPSASYQTITTDHFRITYTPEIAPLVNIAAGRAEEAYLLLLQQLATPPKGRIDLLLSDNSDITNGYATPFPSNRIVIFVKPPVTSLEFQHFSEWIDLVITHELAHVFHLDQGGRVSRALRAVFGRLPAGWPVFPVLGIPDWSVEGLAVEFESRGTGYGRTHGSFHEMVVRTAALEHDIDPIDRISGDTPIWPGGLRAYVYGSLFMDYLARKHGPRAMAELVAKTKGSILPPPWFFNRIGRRALGTALTREYDTWIDELGVRYRAQADTLRATGLTTSERITEDGRYAQFPRVSPDGSRLAYVEDNGIDASRTRVISLNDGREVWSARRNGTAQADWLSNERLITSQWEFTDRYGIFSDLYNVTANGDNRLTKRARLEDPDVDARGVRVIAVEAGRGGSRLVLLNGDGDAVRGITTHDQRINWAGPRFSPAGERIAVTRWTEGLSDLVILDTLGAVITQVTADSAVDGSPAWSPDGRYVLFNSDRTGITNLYAYDVTNRRIAQVTNVLTGAFQPEVAPDGRTLFFSAYHYDGFYIERMPFEPAGWRPIAETRLAFYYRPRVTLDSAATLHANVSPSNARGYSPLHTLRPFYWTPIAHEVSNVGQFMGVATSGRDLLGRHSYDAAYAEDFGNARNEYYLNYSWAGLGNPVIGLSVSRDWDYLGTASLIVNRPDRRDTVRSFFMEREDEGALTVSLVKQQFRWSASVTAGAELERRRTFAVDSAFRQRFDLSTRTLYGPVVHLGFANYRTQPFSISREDGVLLQLTGRARIQADSVGVPADYREIVTANRAYKSLGRLGYAKQVIALRWNGVFRSGSGAQLTDVGGVAGTVYDVGPATVGDADGGLLAVRGYPGNSRIGNRAWAGSAEYRFPAAMVGRGYKLWPFFLDRVYGAAFYDAGDADCDARLNARFPRTCSPPDAKPLQSVGAEVAADLGLFAFFNVRMRIGMAQPLVGTSKKPVSYLTFGQAF